MSKSKLPKFFEYKSSSDLTRIGKSHDGGYLVSEIDIQKSDFLISLGMSDDWSFEQDFVKRNNVDVLAYDASIGVKFWINLGVTFEEIWMIWGSDFGLRFG